MPSLDKKRTGARHGKTDSTLPFFIPPCGLARQKKRMQGLRPTIDDDDDDDDAVGTATDMPSQEEVRIWASANGLVTPDALHQFLRQVNRGERAQGPYERALMQMMSDHYYYGTSEKYLLDPHSLQFAYAQILPHLARLIPGQYAGMPVPRLTPGGPAPQGDWVDPLFDPLYRYPDGTLTPFWPPSKITTTDYVDQTLRELLHYPPGDDTRTFVEGAHPPDQVGFLLGVEDMFAAMQFAYGMGSKLYGRQVAPEPVLSGPRAFRAVLHRWPILQPNLYSLQTPFLVLVITEPGQERAVIAHNARVVASVDSLADESARDDDNEPIRAFGVPALTPMMGAVNGMRGSLPPIPKVAWRALLDDMLDAVRAGRAEEVGLYPTPPGSIALSNEDAALIRPGSPQYAPLMRRASIPPSVAMPVSITPPTCWPPSRRACPAPHHSASERPAVHQPAVQTCARSRRGPIKAASILGGCRPRSLNLSRLMWPRGLAPTRFCLIGAPC